MAQNILGQRPFFQTYLTEVMYLDNSKPWKFTDRKMNTLNGLAKKDIQRVIYLKGITLKA